MKLIIDSRFESEGLVDPALEIVFHPMHCQVRKNCKSILQNENDKYCYDFGTPCEKLLEIGVEILA